VHPGTSLNSAILRRRRDFFFFFFPPVTPAPAPAGAAVFAPTCRLVGFFKAERLGRFSELDVVPIVAYPAPPHGHAAQLQPRHGA
jgi:hypothetical protein